MQITVKLFAHFRNDRFKIKQQVVPRAITCGEVVAALTIPAAEIGIVLINGRHVQLSQPLQEGDTLALFPLVGGG